MNMKRKKRVLKCPNCSVRLVKTNVKGIKRCLSCGDEFKKKGNSLYCQCGCNTKYRISD